MPYRLIALDLDGTLLNRKKQISPRTRAALNAARERGILAVVATGRTPHSARAFSLAIGGGPTICCNGGGILSEDGSILIEKGLPQGPLLRVLALGREAGLMLECYTPAGLILDRPLEQVAAYWRWVRPAMGLGRTLASLVRVWRVNRIRPVRSLIRWAEQPGRPAVWKLMVIGRGQDLAGFADRLRREMPGLEVTSSASDNLEVTAAGVSKGTALEQLGARLRIPRSEMIAFGDSANDLEMLRYAGLGVAMGNAPEQVRAAADLVTATADEEGVALVIEEKVLT